MILNILSIHTAKAGRYMGWNLKKPINKQKADIITNVTNKWNPKQNISTILFLQIKKIVEIMAPIIEIAIGK